MISSPCRMLKTNQSIRSERAWSEVGGACVRTSGRSAGRAHT